MSHGWRPSGRPTVRPGVSPELIPVIEADDAAVLAGEAVLQLGLEGPAGAGPG